MRIGVIGNTASNAGLTSACDLALGGHDVAFAVWGRDQADFEKIGTSGGVCVHGDAKQLTSGRLGFAKFRLVDKPAHAVRNSELVILDLLPREIEQRVAEIAPALVDGQVLHINTHSYWSALRAANVLDDHQRRDVVVTEIIAPTISGRYSGDTLETDCLRGRLSVAAFPASKSELALNKVRAFYPDLVPAKNVLQTGFSNLNFLLHPSVALLNVGWLDRCGERGETIDFWGTGATDNTQLLASMQDQERHAVCEAFSVSWRPMVDHVRDTYSAAGENLKEVLRSCPFYRSRPPRPADVWRGWLSTDLPQAHMPFLEFASLVGVEVPIHQAYLTVLGALLDKNALQPKITLASLKLDGMTVADILTYVETGARRGR